MSRRWARGRLFDHAAAVMLYEPCVEQPTATVQKVNSGCRPSKIGWSEIAPRHAIVKLEGEQVLPVRQPSFAEFGILADTASSSHFILIEVIIILVY